MTEKELEQLTQLTPEAVEQIKNSDIRIAIRSRRGNRVLDCHDCPHWQDGDDNVTCEYPDCPPCAEHELNVGEL